MSDRQGRNAPLEALLPWEDEDAYAARLDALMLEHAPVGPTETSLVERLAHLLQRRSRLALAERAVHVAEITDLADGHQEQQLLKRTRIAAGPFEKPLETESVLWTNPTDDADVREDAARESEMIARALAILAAGGPDAFAAALEALPEHLRDWWGDVLEDALYEVRSDDADAVDAEPAADDENPPTRADAASLKRFLEIDVADWLSRQDAELDARPAIRLQARGQSFDAFRLAKLYEIDSRLDRQFEKTLAMLIRLQELRAGRAN